MREAAMREIIKEREVIEEKVEKARRQQEKEDTKVQKQLKLKQKRLE
jgi:hypothetical protein